MTPVPRYGRRTRAALGTMMDERTGVFESLGYTLWEWLNPEAVRSEYEAVGKEAPEQGVTFFDVTGAALEDTRDVVVSAREEIAEGAALVGGAAPKLVVAGLVGLALVLAIKMSGKRGRK